MGDLDPASVALRDRVLHAAKGLPRWAQTTFDRDAEPILQVPVRDLSPEQIGEIDTEELSALRCLLHSVVERFGAFADPGVDRPAGSEGPPIPRYGAKINYVAMTDCVGEGDAETRLRISLADFEPMSVIGLGRSRSLDWQKIEPMNPSALRGAWSSAYYEFLKAPNGILVGFGNAALRQAENPDGKGCPFVWAHLDGPAFFLTTLNAGGIELQGVRKHVVELWHTTLGVEEEGTSGGTKPTLIFRSKQLADLYAQIYSGNLSVLDKKLDPKKEILPIQGIQIDSRDRFGNLKLTISFQDLLRERSLRFGDVVTIQVGEVAVEAKIAKSVGDGSFGDVLIVPGSSLTQQVDLERTRADVMVNGGSAAGRFLPSDLPKWQHPKWAGLQVKISKK